MTRNRLVIIMILDDVRQFVLALLDQRIAEVRDGLTFTSTHLECGFLRTLRTFVDFHEDSFPVWIRLHGIQLLQRFTEFVQDFQDMKFRSSCGRGISRRMVMVMVML